MEDQTLSTQEFADLINCMKDTKYETNDRVIFALEIRDKLLHKNIDVDAWTFYTSFKLLMSLVLPTTDLSPLLQASFTMQIIVMAEVLDKKYKMLIDFAKETNRCITSRVGGFEPCLVSLFICNIMQKFELSSSEFDYYGLCKNVLCHLNDVVSRRYMPGQFSQVSQRSTLLFLALYAQIIHSKTLSFSISESVCRIMARSSFGEFVKTVNHPTLTAAVKLIVHATGTKNLLFFPPEVLESCSLIQRMHAIAFTPNRKRPNRPDFVLLVTNNNIDVAKIYAHRDVLSAMSPIWRQNIENCSMSTLTLETTVPASTVSIFVSVAYALILHNRVEFALPVSFNPASLPLLFNPFGLSQASSNKSCHSQVSSNLVSSNETSSNCALPIPQDNKTWTRFLNAVQEPVIITLSHAELCNLYTFAKSTKSETIAQFAFAALIKLSSTFEHGKALGVLSNNQWKDWDVLFLASLVLTLQSPTLLSDTVLSYHLCELFSIHGSVL